MKNTYYFITIQENTPSNFVNTGNNKRTRSLVIKEHPAAYLMKKNGLNRTEVTMLFFEEITEGIYQKYKDKELCVEPVS